VVLQTKNTSETVRIGKWIGSHLRTADIVALAGDLGAGKTHFIKGLAAGIGIEKPSRISSPSYVLIHEYPGKLALFHIDLFRLETESEAEELGLEEYFGGRGVTAIEWADRIPSLLPKEILWVHIRYTGKQTRSIEIVGRGERYEALVKKLSDFRMRYSECGGPSSKCGVRNAGSKR
jgi:tRNA threonylcarbamoyladenosine biosynthesis protein TsaE